MKKKDSTLFSKKLRTPRENSKHFWDFWLSSSITSEDSASSTASERAMKLAKKVQKSNQPFYLKYIIILSTCLLASCQRSSGDVWEDTKTCGRYFNKGVHSLFGRHYDEEEYAYLQERESRAPFVALNDDAAYDSFHFEEVESSSEPVRSAANKLITASIDQFSEPTGSLKAIFANVHFDTDNYSVMGNENYDILQNIADYLQSHPSTYVYIEGHADERGAAAYNLSLGSRRANAVKTFLLQNGVLDEQLLTISYGKERPVAMSHDQASWRINRRAQFKILEK